MKAPSIHLTIDRLVLHGIDPAQRHAVAAALAAELERRLAMPGGASALGADRHLAKLPAQPLRVNGTTAAALGMAAARGIAGALKT